MAQDHSVFSNIQDNRTSSLAEQVADQINQVIIDQNINAGEKLPNEFELAARLNVGRGTIREAVKLLVARNCLEIRRGKGTFVVEKPGQIEDPLGFAYVKDKITLAVDLMLFFGELLLMLWCGNPLPALCVGIVGALVGLFSAFLPPLVSYFVPFGYYIPLSAYEVANWDQASHLVTYGTRAHNWGLLAFTILLGIGLFAAAWRKVQTEEV